MITFIINFNDEKIQEGISKIFLYPYLANKKIRIIEAVKMEYEEILNEIKYFYHNQTDNEFQIILVLPIYDNSKDNFGGNLANRFKNLAQQFLERMYEERLEAARISCITLDDLERDILTDTPLDINSRVAEELNIYGYVETELFMKKDILEISESWKEVVRLAETDINGAYEKFKEDLDDIVREKSEKIKALAVDESIKISTIKKIKEIIKKINDNMKFEFMTRKKYLPQLDINQFLIETLKKERCYFEFLFSQDDLELLERCYREEKLLITGEDQFNLSSELIEKLKIYRGKISETIKKIIDEKHNALENIEKSDYKNLYLKQNNLTEVMNKFKKKYIENYLDRIINDRSMENSKIREPQEILKGILVGVYGIESSDIFNSTNFSNIYRVTFNKNNKLKYNEYKLKFIYFLLFLIEYGEKKENYSFGHGFYTLDKISFKSEYLGKLFDKYIIKLQNERESINSYQNSLKATTKIKEFKIKEVPHSTEVNVGSIQNIAAPVFSVTYNTNDIDVYRREWRDKVKEGIDRYIESNNESFLSYQGDKNKTLLSSSDYDYTTTDIDSELKRRQNILNEAKKELQEAEEDIKTLDIKNEWLNKNSKVVDERELENLLDKRLRGEDRTRTIFFTIFFIVLALNWRLFGSWVISLIMLGAAFLVTIFTVIFKANGVRNSITEIIKHSIAIRDKYIRELEENYKLKKQYIDKQFKVRVADKNYLLAKKEEKIINERIEVFSFYKETLGEHCQIVETLLEIINKFSREDEIEYKNEEFSNKLNTLDVKKAPFENDIFSLRKYVEISKYTNFDVMMNTQYNEFDPEYIVGCQRIVLNSDKRYKEID